MNLFGDSFITKTKKSYELPLKECNILLLKVNNDDGSTSFYYCEKDIEYIEIDQSSEILSKLLNVLSINQHKLCVVMM